jgi:fibronectin type 3 domain-containing protein
MKKRRFTEAIIVFAFFCLITPIYADTPWLHADANKIKDPNGNIVVLRGVDTIDIGTVNQWRGGLNNLIERVTNKSNTEGTSPGWYPKVIRLAIYPQDETATSGPWYWEPNHDDYYNNLLRPAVDLCKEKDIYVIIDWHYVGRNTYDMNSQTTAFWSYMAPKFAGDSHVLFELFNEPLNNSEGSEAANWARLKTDMQNWINIVRASAPNNLILVGAPSWSQQVGPAAANPFSTSNPNNTNLVMVVHIYPGHWLLWGQDYFKSQVTTCITRYPVFASEWGFWGTSEELLNGTITNYGLPIMDYYESLKISHSAWVTDYGWNPQMFTSSWVLRVGEAEMGGFVKDMLYAKRNSDQPGGPGDTVPPAAPTGLIATGGNSTVSLNWNDNNETDLAGYNVYRSLIPGGPYSKLNGSLLSSSNYTDNAVNGGVTYYYVVRAVDTFSNESGNSNQASATPTDTMPPAAPTGLSASAGNQTVSLDWSNNSEADINSYNVYRSTTSGGTYTRLNGTLLSNSNYTDNSVTNGTTYYYVVTAVDTSANESANSSQVSATPYIPTDVNILGSWISGTSHTKETGSGRALVFIAHAEHTAATSLTAVTYGGQTMTKVIERSISSGSPATYAYVTAYTLNEANVAAATSDTFVPTWSATPSSFSYASVFLSNVNQTNLVGATDGNTTTTLNPIKTNPLSANNGDMVIVAAICGNLGSYTLNNGFIEGTDQSVGTYGHTGVTGHKPATGAPETPSATHTSLNRQAIIGFVVKAPADIPPSAPTGLAATAGNNTVSLDWNNNGEGDLAGYNVYRSTTSGSGYVKLNSSLLSISDYNDSNVSNGMTYYYVVTAVDAGSNESVYSSEVSATPNIPVTGTGAILREWWTDITGTAVSDLTSNVNYPDNSTGRELITKLQGPTNWADSYGTSIRGYVIPPADGNYTFTLASDANSELWLSTNNNQANVVLIAYMPGSSQSSPKSLVAGQKYYVEVLHKAGTGNDNISVSWQGPALSQQVIDGLYLSPCSLDFRDLADLAQQWNRGDCNAGNNWCGGQDRDRDGNVQIDDLKTFAEEWLTGL